MEIVLPGVLQQTPDLKWVSKSKNVYSVPQARAHPEKRGSCLLSVNFKSKEIRNDVCKIDLIQTSGGKVNAIGLATR